MTILYTKSKIRKHALARTPAAKYRKHAGTAPRDKFLGAVILAFAALLFLWFTVILCRPLFVLATNPNRLERFIQRQGTLGRFAFFGIQILQGFLPIPLELTAAAGGYAFGRVQGALLTLCAAMLSTTAIFYFTKIFGHKLIDLFFTPTQQRHVNYMRDEKVRTALTWLVFLIPGTPKRIFVFSAGLVPQSFTKFLAVSTLARAPALVACSFGGYALENGNYTQAAVIFVITGLLGISGIIAYRMITKSRNRRHRG